MTLLVKYAAKLTAEDKKEISEWAARKRAEAGKKENHSFIAARIDQIRQRRVIQDTPNNALQTPIFPKDV